MSQDDTTDAAAVASVAPTTGSPALAMSADVTQPQSPADVTSPPAPAGVVLDGVTIVTNISILLNAVTDQVMTTMAPAAAAAEPSATTAGAPAAVPEKQAPLRLVTPVVNCMEVIGEDHVKAIVKTTSCEETKSILEAMPAAWCAAEDCRLDVSQDGNKIMVASPDVFIGVLLTGLLLAAGLIGGYCYKNRRTCEDKGVRLADEAYPVDGENQGNTLVSVAPLNPPPETQEPTETTEVPELKEPAETPEKPSANGETLEEVKSEPAPPPPTNGHSTAAKTADTEL
ncbi:unnamed protein product [Merluccius merluccius]